MEFSQRLYVKHTWSTTKRFNVGAVAVVYVYNQCNFIIIFGFHITVSGDWEWGSSSIIPRPVIVPSFASRTWTYNLCIWRDNIKLWERCPLSGRWNTEDVLQATLVKLIDKLPELRQKKEPQLIGYISATARNTAYNFLRAQKKIAPFSFEEYMQQSKPIAAYKWSNRICSAQQSGFSLGADWKIQTTIEEICI